MSEHPRRAVRRRSYSVNGVAVDANGTPLTQPEISEDSPLAEWPMLAAAGYVTVEDVGNASDEQLRNVDGIGAARLQAIRKVAPYVGVVPVEEVH